MLWLVFAIIAALTVSAENITEKGLIRRQDPALFSAIVMVLSGLIVLPFIWIVDWSKITLPIFLWIVLCSLVVSSAYNFSMRSMRHLEISVFSPMSTLTPAIVAIIAAATLGESLSHGQIAGLFLLICGGYALQLKPGQDWLYPIQRMRQSKDIHYLLVSLVLYPVASTMGRFTFTHLGIQPYHYFILIRVLAGVYYASYIILFRGGVRTITRSIPKHKGGFFWTSLLYTTYGAATGLALAGAYVVKVLAVIRLSSLITTVVGGEIFHEKNIGRKTFLCLLMVIGVIWVAMG